MPNGADPRTPSRRIADDLLAEITSGRIPPGGQLPSTAALVERYGVSRETIRQVIRQLKAMGVVVTRQGAGAYVRLSEPLDWWPSTFEHSKHRRDRPGSEYDAWAATVAATGRSPRQDVHVDQVEPPTEVAKQLRTSLGDLVAVRYRVRFVDDVPYQTADSYYPLWVADGTPILEAPADVTIPGGLMAAAGQAQVRFEDVLTVRMPTLTDQQRLDLAATGTPVAEHMRTGYNSKDEAVRVIITVLPGDRNQIRWHVGDQ